MTDTTSKSSWKTFLRLYPFLRPHLFWLVLSVFCSFVGVLLNLSIAYFVHHLTDTALGAQRGNFLQLFYLSLAAIGGGMILTYLGSMATAYYNVRTFRDLRNHVTSHFQHLPVSYVDSHHTGDIVSRLNNDMPKITDFFQNLTDNLFQPLMLVCAFTYMLLISWQLLLAIGLLMPISALLYSLVSKPIEDYSRQQMERLGQANSVMQDTLSGIPLVKAFNLQKVLAGKYGAIAQEIAKQGLRSDRHVSILIALILALRYAPQLIVPFFGGYLIMHGQITVGGLLACAQLAIFISTPIETILGWLRQVRETLPAVERIVQIMDQPVERLGKEPFAIKPQVAPVEFESISFSYNGGPKVLDNLNLRLQTGQTVALVGPSGCGKSTVLKLLCGFYEPQSGCIQVYGNDLARVDLAIARTQMSLVSQDTFLFPATIAENIAYGRPGATSEAIVAAAQVANAHDFIMAQPEAYDTLIGERGINLSGGERQRVALARAVLKDAPLLLLDEPTSALDAQSEELVQEALERFMQGRTTLLIAHRLSTIKNVDQILVLDQGSIQECGTYDELMRTDGLYKSLYLKQTSSDH